MLVANLLGRGEGSLGGSGVRTIEDEDNFSFIFGVEFLPIIRWDNQADAGLAIVYQLANIGFGSHVESDQKIIRGAVGIQQGARFGAAVLIENRHRQVAHIVGGGVTQHEKLHHRNQQGNHQGARIAPNLDEFLAHEGG